ncbi:hypothetical protein TTHERM_000691609 (macronuclear) [Tetrahymena thermophila SB210]|uniref:Uncharacterized protein n=1 Tax=Tetrahymena thermophila (strain SB210) TaxID=312017 RepID=W7X425_TETTS|nr:hypothetical protein TTHERM_000691609 [Tetrahymena thermophila SB210]EWS72187.1 hypothetical protein TTHERM_000691609 [Tetrahymena thermophila SB210]|eukprot:XP_012655280.1 hypothetical protein TTHERM_000691609 [Tetrahymena thermophila SB210]
MQFSIVSRFFIYLTSIYYNILCKKLSNSERFHYIEKSKKDYKLVSVRIVHTVKELTGYQRKTQSENPFRFYMILI